jgi:hypothetical protein
MLTSPAGDAVNSSGRLVAVSVALLGCSGTTVRLGDKSPQPYRFGPPRQLTELGTDVGSDNPTLTRDLLDIYFTSNRDGKSTDVWHAHRATADATFGAPEVVSEVSTPSFETSSAISLDGLTLWVGSDRPGGLGDLDVWMSTRPDRSAAWSTPVNQLPLNSTAKDVPRPPGQHGLVMPLASERDSAGVYHTFLSARASGSGPFGPVQPLPELVFADKSTVDAFLTDDGLTMLFSSSPTGGPGDIYEAWRRSTTEPFAMYAPLDDLNTASDDRDPWLTPDGTRLYFASDRSGVLTIYEAAVLPPATP